MQIHGQLIQTMRELNEWPRFRLRLFFEGILAGTLSGFVISFFRWALEMSTLYRENLYVLLREGGFWENVAWFALLLAAAGLLYKLTRIEPMASGSGIPQVKGVIMGKMRMSWLRILWVKLIGGIVGIGLGLSLGREGPSIQLGAVTAQGMSRAFGRTRMEERYLLTAGASAGLAAAFNAPLAGVIFALEELHRNFSGVVLVPAMASAMMATMVSRVVFGRAPIFHFGFLPPFPLRYIWMAVIIAVVVGLAGVAFNFGLLNIHRFYELPFFFHPVIKIAFALVMAGILGYGLPQVLGGGNELINSLDGLHASLGFLVVLLFGKYFFTMISYGCNVPGGFFLPMLVTGALTGSVCGTILIQMGWISTYYLSNIVVISMAAFFAASVHSPITGTILIMEMTSSYEHLLVLCTASMVALVVAELCGGKPIYDTLLKRSLTAAQPVIPPSERRNIVELTVTSGSLAEGKRVGSLPWPAHTLMVDVKRGDSQIIPDANTRLQAGDYIYILSDRVETAEAIRNMVEEKEIK